MTRKKIWAATDELNISLPHPQLSDLMESENPFFDKENSIDFTKKKKKQKNFCKLVRRMVKI